MNYLICMLGIKPKSLRKHQALLDSEPSLQSSLLLFENMTCAVLGMGKNVGFSLTSMIRHQFHIQNIGILEFN